MTTSELWAKAEAEKRWEGETIPQAAKPFVAADNAGAEWGMLHVLSLLESEQAVEAGARFEYEHGDWSMPWSHVPEFTREQIRGRFRAQLAAAVAAITQGNAQ
jgi:hypothetical protein